MTKKMVKNMIERHFEILGLKVRDRVTGFHGVATTLSFDLYGCIQVVITPAAKDSSIPGGQWFDITRLEVISEDPVMNTPCYSSGYIAEGRKGSSDKPLPPHP